MIICGLDEVGRGPLAGPLVAAGVILGRKVVGLNDSKKLNPNQRRILYEEIINTCKVYAVEVFSVEEIDRIGIGQANKRIFEMLIKKIAADKYIVDGNLRITGDIRNRPNIESVIKADAKFPEVMAASIVAKVTRDGIMRNLHKEYPEYGWETNVGYGTKKHISAIVSFGTTPHHRIKFVQTAVTNRLTTLTSHL